MPSRMNGAIMIIQVRKPQVIVKKSHSYQSPIFFSNVCSKGVESDACVSYAAAFTLYRRVRVVARVRVLLDLWWYRAL